MKAASPNLFHEQGSSDQNSDFSGLLIKNDFEHLFLTKILELKILMRIFKASKREFGHTLVETSNTCLLKISFLHIQVQRGPKPTLATWIVALLSTVHLLPWSVYQALHLGLRHFPSKALVSSPQIVPSKQKTCLSKSNREALSHKFMKSNTLTISPHDPEAVDKLINLTFKHIFLNFQNYFHSTKSLLTARSTLQFDI